jgi:hypothetical protein
VVPKTITDRGACKGTLPEDFYHESYDPKGEDNVIPLPDDHICHKCPVEMKCREYGLHNEVWGTWGGMTQHELYYERIRLGIRQPSSAVGRITSKGYIVSGT